jgi:hypothetical protein
MMADLQALPIERAGTFPAMRKPRTEIVDLTDLDKLRAIPRDAIASIIAGCLELR